MCANAGASAPAAGTKRSGARSRTSSKTDATQASVLGIGAQLLRQAPDQRPQADTRFRVPARPFRAAQRKNSEASIGTLPFASVRLISPAR